MSFKGFKGFKRLVVEDAPSFDDLATGILNQFDEEGLSGANDEPETIVIMRNTKTNADGYRMWEAVVYNGATVPEIIADLNTPKP